MAYHAGAEDHADVGEGEDDLLALEAARRQAEDAELVLLRRAADAVGRNRGKPSRVITGEPYLLVGHVLLQLGHLLRHRREDPDRPVIGRHDLPRAQLLELSQEEKGRSWHPHVVCGLVRCPRAGQSRAGRRAVRGLRRAGPVSEEEH